ncbi:glycosyltransferase family 1 protein, partial [bacterium]
MLARLLSWAGHNPIPFAMKTPHDLPTPYSKYFVSFIDFKEELRKSSPKSFFQVLLRIFHFSEAAQKIDALLADVQVDIVHLNIFLHHISLSIIEPIKKRRIPIVWSLHDH